MKKFLLLIFALISLNAFSQLQVKEGSFKYVPGGVIEDKLEYTDGNDLPMALIKISTENIPEQERMRLVFVGNRATQIVKKPMTGSMWIYISADPATFIDIRHPDYGTYKFLIPEKLCDYCVYEMVLQYVPLTPAPETVQQKKYHLVVSADQSDATIYIDDEPLDIGQASKLVIEGTTHTYKIECNLYYAETGSVTVKEKTVIEKTLRPNFGYINITTAPEQGAKVFVNGEYLGVSPIKTDKLKSGTHTVRVMKDMFKMKEEVFTVNDGKTTDAILNMAANFVNVTINTDADSDIYVDDEYKGTGKWTGRLSDGGHIFEARKTNHKTNSMTVDLVLGETKTFAIDAPKPIYGSLEVNSTPMNATIYIDGKCYGETPNYINEILVGEHELKLTKQGCAELIVEEILEGGYVMQDEYKTIHYKDIKDAEIKLIEYYEERKQKQVKDVGDLCYFWNEYFPYQMFIDLIKKDRRTIAHTFEFEEIETISSDDGNIKLYKWHLNGGSLNPGFCNGVLSIKNGDNYKFYNSYENDYEYGTSYSLEISLYTQIIKEVELHNGKKVYLTFWADGYSNGVESYVLDKEKGIVEYPFFLINDEMKSGLEYAPALFFNDCYKSMVKGKIEWSESKDIRVHLSSGYEEIYHCDGYRYELKEVVYDERIPLYEELRDFKSNMVVLDFSPFVVRIDKMPNGNYRYASWHEKEMSEKPNLVINNSSCKTTKNEIDKGLYGEKIEYTFTNGEYQYIVSYYLIQYQRYFEEIPLSLVVKCDGKTIKTITKE